jgi:opacity protein-like surface antigen
MKKLLLVMVLLILIVSTSYSQLGIRGGLALGTITGDDKALPLSAVTGGSGSGTIDPTTHTGLTGGVSYRIGLILGLAIEPGVYYVQGGTVFEIPNTPMVSNGQTVIISGKATQNLDYLQIPVVAKFTLPIPIVSPYVEAGMAYSLLLSAKMKADMTGSYNGTSQSYSNEEQNKDSFSKSDVSLVFGVGVEFIIIDVNARLILGQSTLDVDGQKKVYNRTFMITAGLRF